MPKLKIISFKGRVLPEIRNISAPDLRPIHFEDPCGFSATIKISIKNSVVTVDFNIKNNIENYLQFCMVRAHELATAAVDIIAFKNGWSLSVIIDSATEGDTKQNVALSEASVKIHGNIFDGDEEYQKVMSILLEKFDLRFAMRDLISSLGATNYSAIAACRAIEAIRTLITPSGPEDRAWKAMREALNLERGYVQRITDAARKPRHGSRGSTDGETQMTVTLRAWSITRRYIEFIKRGGVEPLPPDEFPLLAD